MNSDFQDYKALEQKANKSEKNIHEWKQKSSSQGNSTFSSMGHLLSRGKLLVEGGWVASSEGGWWGSMMGGRM
jgi:hypothetical protein